MSIVFTAVELYRTCPGLPPDLDGHLWAESRRSLNFDGSWAECLNPRQGSPAALYRVQWTPGEAFRLGWLSGRLTLQYNGGYLGELPISWYTGNPTDWPSGIARFQEVGAEPQPGGRPPIPPSVWTVGLRRIT